MKLAVFLTLLTVMQAFAGSYAQTITLNAHNLPLPEVMKHIQTQSGYLFFLKGEELAKMKVNALIRKADLPEAMDLLTQDLGLEWVIKEKTIILRLPEQSSVKNALIAPRQAPQERVLSGTVLDEYGAPIESATVSVKGTALAVTTDSQGNYRITLPDEGHTLVFSTVGFQSVEHAVGNQQTINVTLKSTVSDLDEVVVVGYGTTNQKELTSAISSLRQKDFNKGGNITDPVGLLQGKVAGLNIVRGNGGDPSQGLQIQLRGISTLAGGSGPLFVIDGVIGGDIRTVNLEEIETIDILKDGSAAAIYGTRGTNGVIIITTKRVRSGDRTLDFSTWVSTQTVAKKLENLNADEFREALKTYMPNQAEAFDYGHSTDWFKEITHRPLDQYYNLAMSGGTDRFSYKASANYRTGTGIVRNNFSNRLQAHIGLQQKEINDRLTLDYNISYQQSRYRNAEPWALQQAFRYNPTEPVYDPENTDAGGYSKNYGPFNYVNPVAIVNERERGGENQVVIGSVKADFSLTNSWSVGGFASTLVDGFLESHYGTKYFPWEYGRNGVAYKNSGKRVENLLEFTTDYDKTFGQHKIQLVGGYSYQEQTNYGYSAFTFGFDTDDYGYNNMGAGTALAEGQAGLSSHKSMNKLIAFFGRTMYNYADRYLLTVAARHEGSTRFGTNNKWGFFPAVSAGWRLKGEDFLADVQWISDLKARVGYGITGNQDIGNYRSLQLLTVGGRFLSNGKWINSYRPASNPNPNLRWERKAELNMGVDVSLWDSRLTANLDYYKRTTTDLLWTYRVPVPPNVYNEMFANVGTMENKGFEATITAVPIRKPSFSWSSSLLFSTNSNKLISFSDADRGYELSVLNQGYLSDDIQTWTHQITEGGAIGNFVAPVFTGLDDEGFPVYKDKNNDGSISDADREIVGNAFPDFQLSLNNSFSYKNWDLGIFLRGVFGHDILNVHRIYFENFSYLGGKNILKSALDHPENKGSAQYSSRYIEDASYVKLDNVVLGYNFNVNRIGVHRARVYFAGQQLLTFTKYKGVDPEITISGLAPGIDDYAYYPRTRTFTFGVNLSF